jgi:hypothetical protein
VCFSSFISLRRFQSSWVFCLLIPPTFVLYGLDGGTYCPDPTTCYIFHVRDSTDTYVALEIPKFFIERYATLEYRQSPFVRIATPFQDIVIRFVRYGFANLPAKIGRIFFSKSVSLPFLRYRMLRHGYTSSPIHWQEINWVSRLSFGYLS